MRRAVFTCLLLALVGAPSALAHGRTATVALDYRLTLDAPSAALTGVHLRILDGDRALQVTADPGVAVLIRGVLREPLLRIDDTGVWANAASPTATADKVVAPGRSGWVRLSTGRTISWHEHRLQPPRVSTPGPAGRFVIPVEVSGRATTVGGSFERVARPSGVVWLLCAAMTAVGLAGLVRARRGLRDLVVVILGTGGGAAALIAVTTFAARDAPTGGVSWLQIGSGVVIGAVLVVLLLRSAGRRRVHVAGVIGAIAVAASLGSLPVFWHGNVISALPGTAARIMCLVAIVAGGIAAVLSFIGDSPTPHASQRQRANAPRLRGGRT
ncbi:MAG: hypothetical protein F2663_01095 [Actinobacteria bacterium]|uniref:Unannotated protein n=1 Tax=freshwater metagenome TaxID=449393 RepID=A0A6J6NKZ3_9ZZZZ|nr:hypothetical protein [Actinomycetota bacterium]